MITTGQLRPADLELGPLRDLPALPQLPDLPKGAVPRITENGEALMDVEDAGLRCLHSYAADGWPGASTRSMLRPQVVDRLTHAERLLPDGFTLAIFDGYRTLETQRALFHRFYGPESTLPPGYVADPNDRAVPPPHSTGAAVDLTLAWDDKPLALGTWFDEFTPLAATAALENDPAWAVEASLRRILHAALRATGFATLSSEWWHVSYGDQQWAHQYHQPHAIYGPAQLID